MREEGRRAARGAAALADDECAISMALWAAIVHLPACRKSRVGDGGECEGSVVCCPLQHSQGVLRRICFSVVCVFELLFFFVCIIYKIIFLDGTQAWR